jgi:hypothetical protein
MSLEMFTVLGILGFVVCYAGWLHHFCADVILGWVV